MKINFNQELTKELNHQQAEEFVKVHDAMELEEVQEIKDKMIADLSNLEVVATEELKKTILDFVTAKERIGVYGSDKWHVIVDLLDRLKDKKVKTFGARDFIILREFHGESKFTSVDAIKKYAIPFTAIMEPINIEIHLRNQLISQLAHIIVRKENEAKTGLEYAEGDLEKTMEVD